MKLSLPAVPLDESSYLSTLSFGDIARLLNEKTLYVANSPELPDFAQRKLNPAKAKAIAQYILQTYKNGETFLLPIVINVQPHIDFQDGQIFIPYQSVLMRLVDGQHRCFGILQAIQDKQDKYLAELQIGVLFHSGLCLEHERQSFHDYNSYTQKPNQTLLSTFNQQSIHNIIAQELMGIIPKFRDNVEIAESTLGKNNPRLVSVAILSQSTKYMFPYLGYPDLDAAVAWCEAFWMAVIENLPPSVWDLMPSEKRFAQRQQLLCVNPVFFLALGLIGRDLLIERVPKENLAQWLRGLKLFNWQINSELWQLKKVTNENTNANLINLHMVLQEFLGLMGSYSSSI